MLGQDKEKMPLPPPFDEKSVKDDENPYLEPIVHFEGPAASENLQMKEVSAFDKNFNVLCCAQLTFRLEKGQEINSRPWLNKSSWSRFMHIFSHFVEMFEVLFSLSQG